MKTTTINNLLLTSSILFFSACSTTTPKVEAVNKKVSAPSLSPYNIIGIDRNQPTHAPIFVVDQKPKKVFNFITSIPETYPIETEPIEAIEPIQKTNYISQSVPLYEEKVDSYASATPILSTPLISDTIEVVSYAPTRTEQRSRYSQNIEVISYGSPQRGENRNHTSRTYNQPSNSSAIKNEIESKAKSFLGIKYVWGATGPNKFDCSGFTQWVYRDSGITIPRVSKDQAKVGNYVKYSNLKRGDMVFFDTKKRRSGIVTHVGIYLGNNNFIHASSSAKKVVIYNFDEKPFYKERFLWGRRVINDNSYLASK